MRSPDLEHRVDAWCRRCDRWVTARQSFRHRTKAWPIAEWGKLGVQYDYRCITCLEVAEIPFTPASTSIDWSDLGRRIADRDKPLAATTLARIQRGIDAHGGRLPHISDHRTAAGIAINEPISTLTTAETHALVTGLQVVAAGNTFERPGSTCRVRSLDEPTWTQHTTASVGIATHGSLIPFRKHTVPTGLHEPVFTQTAQRVPGLALWPPTGAMFAKNNGGPDDTIYHATSDPFGTMTARDTTSLAATTTVEPDDVHFRMLTVDEIRRCMKYPADWKAVSPDPDKEPTKRDQVRLLGDGVTPPVLTWCTNQLLEII